MMNGIFCSWIFVPIYGNFSTDDDDDHLPDSKVCEVSVGTPAGAGFMNHLLIAKLVQIIRRTPWFMIDIFTYPLVN